MSRPRVIKVPLELRTLDQVEEWARAEGVDFWDVLWSWPSMASFYTLAHRSGTTPGELMERMLTARGIAPATDGAA